VSRARFPAALRMLTPLLAGLLMIAVTVMLGNWQVRRAQQKTALQAVLDAAAQRPAQAVERGQRVLLKGKWLASATATAFLDNRTHAGRAGYHVLAPLRLADGSGVVLVNRGWVAADADRTVLPEVALAPAQVTLEARVHVPEADAFTLAKAGQIEAGRVWQAVDLSHLAARADVSLPLCSMSGAGVACLASWLALQTSDTTDGLVRDWPLPAAGIDRHRGYAFQWYCLAALAAALTAGYAWRLFSRRHHDDRNPRLVGS
jgi:surfeit locus 1 family protein